MTLPDLFCDDFRVLLITQMIHSPFTVPSARKVINRVIQKYKQQPRKHTINADERNYWHQKRTVLDCGLNILRSQRRRYVVSSSMRILSA